MELTTIIGAVVAIAIVAGLAVVLWAATQLSGQGAAAERSEDDN